MTQGKLSLGLRSEITAADSRYPALLLLNAVYGAGMTSKLFLQIREEQSLCYYANSSLDKIKKLARLNAVASFKSTYELNGLEKPARDLSIVQNALAILKDKNHKWFWFATTDACTAWQNESFRKELTFDGSEFGTYDLFLANYAYAVFFDPKFKKSSLWKPVFTYFKYICNEESHALIKSRFNDKELNELRVLDAVRNFKAVNMAPSVVQKGPSGNPNRIQTDFSV